MIHALLLSVLSSSSVQRQLDAGYNLISRSAGSNDTGTAALALSNGFQQTLVNGGVLDKAAYLSTTLAYDPTREILQLRYSIQHVDASDGRASVTVTVHGIAKYGWPGHPKNIPARWIESDKDEWVQDGGAWKLLLSRQISVQSWIGGKLVQDDHAPKTLTTAQRAAIVSQLQREAVPMQTDIDADTADLAPLGRWIGRSRIVGLGEATHGTSEFFILKDRIYRYLVEHLHFTVFAMEADWSVGLAIDRYVTTGQGNIRALLASTYLVWNNQETLDLLTWMRRYNAQPGPHPTLHFVGIDVENTGAAASLVERFFKFARPEDVPQITADLHCMGTTQAQIMGYIFGSQAKQDECKQRISGVLKRLQDDPQLRNVTSPVNYATAEQATRVVLEGADLYAAQGRGDNSARDRAMADNLIWATGAYADARIAVWAHNFHVAAYPSPGFTSMGSDLRRHFGRDYYAVGFAFDHGTVSPNGMSPPITIPPAYPLTAEAILRKVKPPAYALDLDAIPSGSPAGNWLDRPEPIQAFGSVSGPQDLWQRFALVVLPRLYDTVIFVNDSHAAHSFNVGAAPHE